MAKSINPEIRFWDKVDKKSNKECWIWNASLRNGGYGQFYDGKKLVASHRFSYELKYGKIPTDLLACHKCDNRKCVNPDHIFLGTHKDNSIDMSKKNRWKNQNPVGSRNGNHKVTEEDVKKMRELYLTGSYTYVKLSKMFNISETQTNRIIKGESWTKI